MSFNLLDETLDAIASGQKAAPESLSVVFAQDRSGPTDQAQAAAVTMPRDVQVTGATASVISTDLITGTVNGWYDARLFHSASIQVIGGAGITAGQIFFEQTNDPTLAAAGNIWPVEEDTIAAPAPILTAQVIGANARRMFRGPVTAGWVRVRISTAFTGGTVQALCMFSQLPYSRMIQTVAQATSGNLQVAVGTSLPAGTSTIGAVNKPAPLPIVDLASGALTATTTTAAITPTAGGSYQVTFGLTAVTGAGATAVFAIEESGDSGANWYQVWQSVPITAIGQYKSPFITLTGNRIRYVQTVSGTTPSFTRSIIRVHTANEVAPAAMASLIEYQLVANGPWLVGYTATTAGVVTIKDLNGVTVTPVATRLTGGSTDQGRQAVDVTSIKAVQHVIPLGFTVPAIGSPLTVTITPDTASPSTQYIAGDTVILSEVDPGGGSSKLVRAAVTSVTGNAVSMTITARDEATALNPIFTASSEITGQTRCGTIPATATGAIVNITAPVELAQVAHNPNDLGQPIAQILKTLPIIHSGIKVGPDIDLLTRLGVGIRDGTEIRLTSTADIAAMRFVSATPLRFCPSIEITFTKAE